MADLGKTQTEWDRFIAETGFFVRTGRMTEEAIRRFSRERVQVDNENDFNSNFTAVTLTGVDFHGNETGQIANTDPGGFLFVRVTVGPVFTIELFRATGGGGGDLMATGTASASGTATMTAANSSGLTGTITLAASVTVETDDVHRLHVFTDFPLELLNLWPSDGTTEEDAKSRAAADRMLTDLSNLAVQMQARVVQGMSEFALTAPDNPTARGNKFLEAADTSLFTEQEVVDASGAVSRPATGFFQTLLAAMRDETTAGQQDIVERVVAAGVGVFDTNNDGQGTVAAHTPDDRTPIGRWTLECVTGLGNGGGGVEEFNGRFAATTEGDDQAFTFSGLRIKQSFKGPNGFGPITLNRTFTKTGDGADLNLGATSTFSTTGETEANTNSGVLNWLIDANGPNFDISFFRASSLASGDLVAKVENVAAGATNVTATARNGSGLTFTLDVGSAPVDTTTGTVDLNYFNVDNAADVPDRFDITTSLTSEGTGSRLLARIFLAEIQGDASSSESQSDDRFARVNTFPPYIAEDV